MTVGHYQRAALIMFFNSGLDTGTVFKTAAFHELLCGRMSAGDLNRCMANVETLSTVGCNAAS